MFVEIKLIYVNLVNTLVYCQKQYTKGRIYMEFIIKNRTYYNSLGQIVTKENFENEWEAFNQKLNEEYNKQLNELISIIPLDLSQEEKMKFLFNWLVNHINYEHNLDYNNDGSVTCPIIEIYNNWGIRVSDKYAPLLLKKTICAGIVPVINDICAKLGIESTSIRGETRKLENGARIQHIWNTVTINGVSKHFDVIYGIYNREKGMNPLDYCLISDEILQQLEPHCNYDAMILNNNFIKK